MKRSWKIVLYEIMNTFGKQADPGFFVSMDDNVFSSAPFRALSGPKINNGSVSRLSRLESRATLGPFGHSQLTACQWNPFPIILAIQKANFPKNRSLNTYVPERRPHLEATDS